LLWFPLRCLMGWAGSVQIDPDSIKIDRDGTFNSIEIVRESDTLGKSLSGAMIMPEFLLLPSFQNFWHKNGISEMARELE